MPNEDNIPTTAMEIANWFLGRSWNDPEKNPQCDQMKLNKLVYYAQAWFLANFDKPLYEDDIEAWPHGPVIRDLYNEFCDFGRMPINRLGYQLDLIDGEFEFESPIYNGQHKEFLAKVWNHYKKFTGIRLSNATHFPGEPWEIISRKVDLGKKPKIPTELIKSVFKKKIS